MLTHEFNPENVMEYSFQHEAPPANCIVCWFLRYKFDDDNKYVGHYCGKKPELIEQYEVCNARRMEGCPWEHKEETKKYRKKPVIVEAYKTQRHMSINTLEGVMHADPGDYIITGVKGETYPCKPDIFEQTYELVEKDK